MNEDERASEAESRYMTALQHALNAKELGLGFIYDLVIRDLKRAIEQESPVPDDIAEYVELAYPNTSELVLPDVDVKVIPSRDAHLLGLDHARSNQFYQYVVKQIPLMHRLEDVYHQRFIPDRAYMRVRNLCTRAMKNHIRAVKAYGEALDNQADLSPEEMDELERKFYKSVDAIPYALDHYDRVMGFRYILYEDIFPMNPAIIEEAHASMEEECKKHGWDVPWDTDRQTSVYDLS